jgi:hypothetical protein
VTILLRAAVDFFFALICLFGLLAAITGGLALWGQVGPTTLPFTARAYAQEVLADPWQGMALYLMIATTLLPTFLHFLTGLWAMFAHRGRLLTAQAERLETAMAAGETLTAGARAEIIGAIRRAKVSGFAMSLAVTTLIFVLFIYPVIALVF